MRHPSSLPVSAPPGLQAIQLGDTVVFSYPLEPHHLAELSAAENEVVRGALNGASNPEIAAQRGCSPRTVANLLARAFKKLGVHSRGELAARVFQARPTHSPQRARDTIARSEDHSGRQSD